MFLLIFKGWQALGYLLYRKMDPLGRLNKSHIMSCTSEYGLTGA